MDDFTRHLNESLKEPEFKKEWDKLDARYKIIELFIDLRNQYKLTQAEFAKKIGTTQSVVSRIENGNVNVGVGFLQKVAEAFGKHLEIKIA